MLNSRQLAQCLPLIETHAPESLQIVSAASLAAQHYPQIDPGQPVLLLDLLDGGLALKARLLLLAVYPSDHAVYLLLPKGCCVIQLSELAASGEFDEESAMYLPPCPSAASYVALQEVVARLRAPDGCPWDQELTWETLKPPLLEETYELLAALDAQDAGKVAEEEGDLLLQVALQTQIAVEKGLFRSGDVMAGIIAKLIRRHPHVFGEVIARNTDEVLANWEAIKLAERTQNGARRSPLSSIPPGLPALSQAAAYQDRMSRLPARPNPSLSPTLKPFDVSAASATPTGIGDLLFELVAWARSQGVDAESALRAANARYASSVEEADGRAPFS